MDRELDVFTNYRNITNKIKKRFLKKPNYTEASEQFGTLTRVLKQQDCPQYAGFCCLAKARCENTIGNSTAEVESLLDAARLFFEAEKANVDVLCPALDEHISESVHCYNQAVKAHQKEALVSLEAANNLVEIGKLDEAYNHYLRTSDIQKELSVIDTVVSLQKAAYCKIYSGQYEPALKHLTSAATLMKSLIKTEPEALTSSVTAIRQSIEVTRVFLLLLLNSSPIDREPANVEVMEKYAWEGSEEDRVLPEDMFLLVQSVVMATQARDAEVLENVEEELYEHLDIVQMDLLHQIVKFVNIDCN